MVSDAGILLKSVYIGAEEIADNQFLWNDGTPLIPETSLWRHSWGGTLAGKPCTAVATNFLIVEVHCSRSKAFVCQYDV